MSEPKDGELPTLADMQGIWASDNPPKRYDHVCKRCGVSFTNSVNDSEYCCVCTVRIIRDEWDD